MKKENIVAFILGGLVVGSLIFQLSFYFRFLWVEGVVRTAVNTSQPQRQQAPRPVPQQPVIPQEAQ